MHGWERTIYTISVQRPQPYNTNLEKERREKETVEDKKGVNRFGQ